MMSSSGLRSVAVRFPPTLRANAYFREHYPETVRRVEESERASMWNDEGASPASRTFDRAMRPFVGDPFRGTVNRHVLAPGESIRHYETEAARAALDVAGVRPSDVDLLLVGSFLPDQIGVGNAAFLARDLGVEGSAWNIESACSSAVVGLEVAAAMVGTGRYGNALVVTSCNYSQTVPDDSPLAWTVGDGAAAMLVSRTSKGDGLLGASNLHTGDTCGTLRYALERHEGAVKIAMRADPSTSRVLRETSERYVREVCLGAARDARMELRDIDAFIFNTPTAWFRDFAVAALEIDRARTVDAYPLYGNVGPVLAPANLCLAAGARQLERGDVVLVCSIGSVASASAVILRWGEVAVSQAIR
jgi:3-oxoacyl-[acyl-carrier-protein] synthase-3